MPMQTLAEYENQQMKMPQPEASGIECPECTGELVWLEKSLFCTDPPMRRVFCGGCRFTRVVVFHG